MKKTDTNNYQHFLNVVDCQQACPAHTPVPEYIRLIAEKRYTEAYLINWESNVFPGILGRVCDRPASLLAVEVVLKKPPLQFVG